MRFRIIINGYFLSNISKIISFTLLMLMITFISSSYADQLEVESVIPAYSASCVIVKDIPKVADAIKTSQAWQGIIEEAKQQLQNNSDVPKPMKFMAMDMWDVLALATGRVAIVHIDPTKMDSPTVIVDLGDSKSVFEAAQKVMQLLGSEEKLNIKTNAGFYLEVPYGTANQNARFAFLDNLFVFAPNEDMFKAVVDVYRDKEPSILADPKFMIASNRVFSDGEAFIYINSEVLTSVAQALSSKEQLKTLGANSVKAIAWKISLLSPTKDQEIYFYSGDSSKLMAQLMSNPGTLTSPHIIPASAADVFFAINAGDLASIMDKYFDEAKGTMTEDDFNKLQSGFSSFEMETGLNLRNDVLQSLTGEIGFAMSVGPEEVASSLQSGIFAFIGVKDRDKLRMVIERLLSKEQVEKTQYKGVDITFISSTTGPEGPMGYAFAGDLLVFSSVKKIMSLIDEDVPLVASERFSQIGSRLTEPYSTLFYFDLSKVMSKVPTPLSQNENAMAEIQSFGSIGGAVTYDGQGYKMKLTGTQGKSWLEVIGDIVNTMRKSSPEESKENMDK